MGITRSHVHVKDLPSLSLSLSLSHTHTHACIHTQTFFELQLWDWAASLYTSRWGSYISSGVRYCPLPLSALSLIPFLLLRTFKSLDSTEDQPGSWERAAPVSGWVWISGGIGGLWSWSRLSSCWTPQEGVGGNCPLRCGLEGTQHPRRSSGRVSDSSSNLRRPTTVMSMALGERTQL